MRSVYHWLWVSIVFQAFCYVCLCAHLFSILPKPLWQMSFIRYHVITRADLHLVRATREVASRIINLIWWHHEMETFSALLALCEGKPPVTGWFPPQRSVTRSFDVCFDLRLNKRLSKQSTARCFDTPSCSLWRHCYEFSLISKWICFFKKSHAIGSHIQVVWPTGLCACMGHGSSDHYVLWLNCTVPRNWGRFTCQSSGSNTLSIIKFTGIAD